MGYRLMCDGCGADIAQADRTNVSRDSIEEGSLRLDLCEDCSAPIRKVPVVVKKQKELKDKIEQNRRASQMVPAATPVQE